MRIMGIDDEDSDPRLAVAAKELTQRVAKWIGHNMTPTTIENIRDEVRSHRAHWRLRGVEFPLMTPVILPSVGQIFLFRQELSHAAVQGVVMKIMHEYPKVDRVELAEEVCRIWPEYASRVTADNKRVRVG